MNHVKILLFATLREKAGVRQLKLDVEESTSLSGLKTLLAAQFPALKGSLAHCLAAIDHEYQLEDTLIPTGAEVALFPPVSGG